MSVMLEQDYASEAEYTEKPSFGRTVARVLMLSLVVTALVAGLYMAFGGNKTTDPLAGVPASQPATTADQPSAVKPAPLTYEQKVAKAADKLVGVSSANRRTELIKYLKVAGIPVTAESSPATAATTACGFLADGYAPNKLVNQVAAGGGYTKQQSKAFLLGASTLYCPTYAKNFR
jgi:hypothetical protein